MPTTLLRAVQRHTVNAMEVKHQGYLFCGSPKLVRNVGKLGVGIVVVDTHIVPESVRYLSDQRKMAKKIRVMDVDMGNLIFEAKPSDAPSQNIGRLSRLPMPV